MPVLTVNIPELAGIPWGTPGSRIIGHVETSADAIVDAAAGTVSVGRPPLDIDETGLATLTLPATVGTYKYRVVIRYSDSGEQITWTSGYFNLTADANLASLTTTTVINTYPTLADAISARDSATASAAAAAASAQTAHDISNIDTSDDVVKALVSDPASGTRDALDGVTATNWAPNHAYAAGAIRVLPDGTAASSNSARTTRATFDATEAANWTAVVGKSGTLGNSAVAAAIAAAVGSAVTSSGADAAAQLWEVLRQNVRDAYYLAIGDSRGDGRDGSGGVYMDEFHELLADKIHAQFPAYTIVEYRLATALDGSYDAPATRYTGTGAHTLYIYNGQAAGTDWSHPLTTVDGHWRKLPQLAHPDLIVFAHGRNEGTYVGVERIYQTVEQIRAMHPQAGVVLATEMPSLDTAANAGYAAQRARETVRAAQALGCGVVDFWQAFTNDSRGAAALLRPDGVHPTAVGMSDTLDFNGNAYTLPTGSQVAADALWAATWTPYPVSPRTLPPPSFTVSGVNLLVNPAFTDWTGATPTGWSASAGATVTKNRATVETGAFAAKIVQAVDGDGRRAYLAQSIDLRPYRGQRLTLATREYIPTAYTGRVQAGMIELEIGTTQVRGRGFLSNCPQGRFFWQVVSIDVPASGADVATARLYADYSAGTTGTAQPTFDRAVLTVGALPRALSSVISPFAGNVAVDPTTLGTAVVRWHKVSSLSALTSGASITTWADSSAKNLALTGGTVKPTYNPSGINGTPGAAFTTLSNAVLVGASGTGVSQPYTLYAVVNPGDILSTRVILGTPNAGLQIRVDTSSIARYCLVTGSAIIWGPAAVSGRPVVLAGVFDGTSSALWVNGLQQTIDASTATATQQLVALNVGNNATPSTSLTFDGTIGEMLAITGHNTDDTIAGVTEYLRTAAAIYA